MEASDHLAAIDAALNGTGDPSLALPSADPSPAPERVVAKIDGRPGRYYVTARDGDRVAFLLGPYPDHVMALERVRVGRDYMPRIDQRAAFYDYGTTRIAPGGSDRVGALHAIFPEID